MEYNINLKPKKLTLLRYFLESLLDLLFHNKKAIRSKENPCNSEYACTIQFTIDSCIQGHKA
jgi:hypothetical protein